MKSESNITIQVWELMREYIPPARRPEISISLLRCLEEFGFEAEDLSDILDEDDHLTAAYRSVFCGGEEEDDGFDGYDLTDEF